MARPTSRRCGSSSWSCWGSSAPRPSSGRSSTSARRTSIGGEGRPSGSRSCRASGIGPIGALDPADQPDILLHVEGRAPRDGRGEMELGVAGLNDAGDPAPAVPRLPLRSVHELPALGSAVRPVRPVHRVLPAAVPVARRRLPGDDRSRSVARLPADRRPACLRRPTPMSRLARNPARDRSAATGTATSCSAACPARPAATCAARRSRGPDRSSPGGWAVSRGPRTPTTARRASS